MTQSRVIQETAPDAEALHNRGNDAFRRGRHVEAMLLYRAAADQDPSRVVTWSNLAQAHLNTSRPLLALEAAARALELDPGHCKSEYRRAQALQSLHQYAASIESLDRCLDLDPGLKTQVQARRGDAEACLSQQRGQRQALDGIVQRMACTMARWLSQRQLDASCSCADFVGPMRLGSTQAGWGLFAGRDIRAGELLLVETAMAFVEGGGPEALLVSPTRKRMSTGEGARLLAKVVQLVRTDPAEALRLSMLWQGCARDRSDPVPVLALLTKEGARAAVLPGAGHPSHLSRGASLSVRNMSDACSLNSWDVCSSGNGLFAVGSMFNHSCMPNCTGLATKG